MKIGSIDLDRDVFIIAEVGNNHEGSYAMAEEMVGKAAEAGAHAVKFQTFKTEFFVSENDQARFQRLKGFELTEGEFEKLAAVARRQNILFMSTPLDLPSARFLEPLVAAYKIASGDNNFSPLLEAVASTGKPVVISGGLAGINELRQAKSIVENHWNRKGIQQSLAVLHCVTSYPVPPHEANLAAIGELMRELHGTVGYSDHTIGIEAAILSVAVGARVIEKHFTLDKNYSDFRDHKLSADPQEMAELVRRVKEASQMLGTGSKTLQECEKPNAPLVRRSIVANRDLAPGHIVTWDDLLWLRPAGGMPPGKESEVVGRKTNKAMKRGEAFLASGLS